MPWLDRLILALNRLRTRRPQSGLSPDEILLLLPRCLQKRTCAEQVTEDLARCRACGACSLGALQETARRTGIRTLVAAGGRQAAQMARAPGIRAIVSVACPKELAEGIVAVFPTRVYAIENESPAGPCVDTRVDAEAVGRILATLLGSPA